MTRQLTAIESVESPIPQGQEEVSTIEPAGCDRVNQPQREVDRKQWNRGEVNEDRNVRRSGEWKRETADAQREYTLEASNPYDGSSARC